MSAIVDIGVGFRTTCAISKSGELWCWETGATQAKKVELPASAVVVSSNFQHTCALLADTSVYCWGDNLRGLLGTGSTENPTTRPERIAGLNETVELTTGIMRTCAVSEAGVVSCWGFSESGALGLGPGATNQPFPTPLPTLDSILMVDSCMDTTCALHANGEVSCWGDNMFHNVGHGKRGAVVHTPQRVDALNDATSITVGCSHTCAMRSTGEVVCWGDGSSGALGLGYRGEHAIPVTVTSPLALHRLEIGDEHTCGLDNAGALYCWGGNDAGQLADTEELLRDHIPSVPLLRDVTAHAHTGYGHCAVVDGTLLCWGRGETTPAKVVSLERPIVALWTGSQHMCVLDDRAQAWCWGIKTYGALGHANREFSPIPVRVDALVPDVSHIACGYDHCCALLGSGDVACWGELEDSAPSSDALDPSHIPGIEDVTQLAASYKKTCVLRSDGSVWCWETSSAAPERVEELPEIREIAAGYGFSCALAVSGEVWCWGSRSFGKLGARDDPSDGRSNLPPAPVPGVSGVYSLFVGERMACGQIEPTQFMCWGFNSHGQFGGGERAIHPTPVPVRGLPKQ